VPSAISPRETPLVVADRVCASDGHVASFQFSVPKGSLAPGLCLCQVDVVDDAAGTFAFPRLALAVR
jgi:hypothetical protein